MSPTSPRSLSARVLRQLRRFGLLSALIALLGGLAIAPALAAPPPPAPDVRVNTLGMSPNDQVTVAIIRANEKAAFDYFVAKGLTRVQAAGVIGNLDQESGMDPTISQIGGGPGRGIAQWSVGGRWDTYNNDNVVQFANRAGVSPWGLRVQLDFIWYELTTYSYYGLAPLRSATTIQQAVVAFQDKYEGCGTCHTDRRVAYAQDAYNRYA